LGRWGTNIKRTLGEIGGVVILVADTPAAERKLRDEELDGVIVATPGSTHAAVALPYIRRGLPTYIEKPMTTTVAEAKKLRRAAKKFGAPVFVGHLQLYNPAYLKTRELAQKLGGIRSLYFEGLNNGPYRNDMSVLWDWGPHPVSMVLDLLKAQPSHISAWGSALLRPRTRLYDIVQLKLLFPKNIVMTARLSWLSPEKRTRLTIMGKRDSVVFDDTAEDKVTHLKGMGPEVHGRSVKQQSPHISQPRYSAASPLTIELQQFLRMVRSHSKPATDIEQGVRVVEILAAAEKSIGLDGVAIQL
ncbi:Gfo/Idh/MocA family oxidoreductase, partial [Patescibacteria group bacterium]|nr:Gfo/Idh/MocA family oxidoreductase [Patescibacteria group bacterium]